jgi:hypothetical protein
VLCELHCCCSSAVLRVCRHSDQCFAEAATVIMSLRVRVKAALRLLRFTLICFGTSDRTASAVCLHCYQCCCCYWSSDYFCACSYIAFRAHSCCCCYYCCCCCYCDDCLTITTGEETEWGGTLDGGSSGSGNGSGSGGASGRANSGRALSGGWSDAGNEPLDADHLLAAAAADILPQSLGTASSATLQQQQQQLQQQQLRRHDLWDSSSSLVSGTAGSGVHHSSSLSAPATEDDAGRAGFGRAVGRTSSAHNLLSNGSGSASSAVAAAVAQLSAAAAAAAATTAGAEGASPRTGGANCDAADDSTPVTAAAVSVPMLMPKPAAAVPGTVTFASDSLTGGNGSSSSNGRSGAFGTPDIAMASRSWAGTPAMGGFDFSSSALRETAAEQHLVEALALGDLVMDASIGSNSDSHYRTAAAAVGAPNSSGSAGVGATAGGSSAALSAPAVVMPAQLSQHQHQHQQQDQQQQQYRHSSGLPSLQQQQQQPPPPPPAHFMHSSPILHQQQHHHYHSSPLPPQQQQQLYGASYYPSPPLLHNSYQQQQQYGSSPPVLLAPGHLSSGYLGNNVGGGQFLGGTLGGIPTQQQGLGSSGYAPYDVYGSSSGGSSGVQQNSLYTMQAPQQMQHGQQQHQQQHQQYQPHQNHFGLNLSSQQQVVLILQVYIYMRAYSSYARRQAALQYAM